MIELAAIDLAGTLVRDDGAVEGAFFDALSAVGHFDDGEPDEALVETVRQTMGRSKITVFREMLGDEDRAEAANHAFEEAYARRVEDGQAVALQGADDALRALRAGSVKIAITTGFSAKTRDLLLTTLGWDSLVDAALSPTGVLRGRPAPDLVLAAVIRLRIEDVRHVAVVGDTTNDLLCGHRAGAGVVAGVLTGAHRLKALEAAPHTHILPTVAELPALIRQVNEEALVPV